MVFARIIRSENMMFKSVCETYSAKVTELMFIYYNTHVIIGQLRITNVQEQD